MVRITFGKIILLFLLIGFGVFLGMDVATRGLDQIKGQAVRVDSTVRGEVESVPTMSTTSQKVAQQAQVTKSTTPQQLAQQTQVTKSTTGQSVQSAQAVKTTKATEQPAAVSRPQQAATLQVSFINRLSNRTGDAIRRLAYGSMQGVTSFFQRVIE
jgi:hypothetical protein